MISYGSVFILFVFITIVTVMLCLLNTVTGRPDELQKQINRNADLLINTESNPLQSLINGSSVNNIPRINLRSTNPLIADANDCARSPKFLSTSLRHTDTDCVHACINETATAFYVTPDGTDEYITDSGTMLRPGTYCTIGNRPECNTRTTVVLMSLNSVVCRPKFPRIVGGVTGNKIIACNNRQINHPRNVLFDRLKNRPYDPLHTKITDEDEKLDDGEYRFVCRFDGMDNNNNKYVEHPYDRFQPMRNYCTSLLKDAPTDIELRIDLSTGDFACYCGDKNKTRVSNMYTGNASSPCTAANYDDVILHGKKRKRTIPYRCFHINSPITDITKYHPCPPEQFTAGMANFATVDMIYTYDDNAPIEHPSYERMSGDGVFIKKGLQLV